MKRKLELNRERIRVLQPDELVRVVGGPGPTNPTDHSADPDDRITTRETDQCPVDGSDQCDSIHVC